MIEITERTARQRTLADLLRERAEERPDHRLYTFLADGEEEAGGLTCGEIDRRARALAAWLQEAGCRGERVLLLFPPGLDFVAAFFGCLYAGAAAVPAYPPRLHRADERLEEVFRDAEPRAVLTTAALLGRLAGRPGGLGDALWAAVDQIPDALAEAWREPDLGPGDLAFLQYTSGSTASPKGVMVTHGNLLANEERIRRAFRQSAESVVVGWLPLYHDMGLIGNVLQPLWSGGRCILMSPWAFLQRPARWLEAISRYRATTSGGPNFAYDLCVRRILPEQRAALDLSSWQVAFNGAEPVRRATLDRFAAAFAAAGFRREAFVPCYGLAEATLLVTAGSDRSDGSPVSCGALPEGEELRIVDPETASPCAAGAVGEIWVAGPSVAKGYWNRPAETRETFGAMLGEERPPFLRTGDLGFVLQGELFVTGRIKDLIILRGRNHYPQDLELTTEQAHPALRPGGGAAFSADFKTDSGEEERLVIVHEIEPRARGREGLADEVAAAVRRALAAEHEVSVHEVVLLAPGTLPRTSSGKVRRRACRAAWQEGTLEVAGRSVAGGVETAALADWLRREVETTGREEGEGVDPVDPLDPDVALVARGLDSLGAVDLVQRIAASTGVELSPADVLRGLTLRELAAEVRARREEAARSTAVPLRVRRPGSAAGALLSFGQQRLWFLHRMDPQSPTENLAGGYRMSGLVRLPALARALGEIVRRHEVLRTVYRQTLVADEPVQIVHPPAPLALPLVDLTDLPAGSGEAEAARLAAEEAARPFDLARGPVLRAAAVRLAPREHLMLTTLHHIACDGWSVGVLLRELGVLYTAYAAGRPSPLPELPLQYVDFAAWQRRWLDGPVLEEQLRFWRKRLAGAPPVLELPADRPRPAVRSWRGARRPVAVPAATVARLAALAQSEGMTLYALLLALFQVLLGRLTGEEDLVVGSPVAGRRHAETRGLIGFFVNTLALRADLGGDPPLSAQLARTRREVLNAFAHQDLPFERLVEELRPGRSLSHAPLFQVLFVLQNAPGGPLELPGLRIAALPPAPRARFDLELELAEEGGALTGTLGFAVDLFDAATAGRLAGHLETLFGAAAEMPEARLSDLPLLTEAEQRELAAVSRGPELETEPATLLDLLAARAAQTPDAEAVSGGNLRLSYRELMERVDRYARRLAAQGAGPGKIVAVQAERSPDLAVALLGALASGAAFLPLDPSQPAERTAFLLQDTGAILPGFDLQGDLSGESAVPRRPEAGDLAYVIYTSGTTGAPKGVMVEHRSLLHTLSALLATFGFAPGERMLAIAPFSFDIFLVELLAPLLAGGSVRLLPLAPGLDLDLLLGELESAARVHAVPAVLRQIVDRVPAGGSPRFAGLREIFTGGDLVPPELLAAARQTFPAAHLAVLYGPTEGAIVCAAQPEAGLTERPLLGRPLPGVVLELRDRHGSLVPLGGAGEVHLGGPGVARGYLGRPGLTAERFGPAPGGSRFYRTGDLARRLPDGTLEFLGRADRQVKVRGIRIEPGEIEARLAGHPGVREAAVIVRDIAGERRLAAFFVPVGEPPAPAELRAHLARTLTRPMLPAAFAALPELPRTPAGKVDRRALAAWTLAPEATGSAAPGTPEEETVAGLWAELLGAGRVGIHEDVFASGAHSLLVTRMAWRLRETFGIELPLRVLFEEPTPAGLARRIAAARAAAGEGPPLVPVERPDPLPLSFAQQRLWFEDQREPGSSLYNMAVLLILRGRLDAAALEGAFTVLVRRHEALRTSFPATRGRPRQEIAPPFPFRLPLVDLTGLPAERREEEARRQAQAEARRPFDLAVGPLLRGFLLRLGALDREIEHRLVLNLHHIVSDGWSTAVLVEEVGAFYSTLAAGRPPVDLLALRPELPVQYADFTLWQRAQLAGGTAAAHLAYWRARLADAPPALELPTDRPRPAVRSTRGADVPLSLSREPSASLAGLGRREGATLFMTLLAAFQALLHRETGAGDLCVGTPAAGRAHSETEGLIGFFVNTLVVRTDVGGSPSFRALVARVRDAVLGASAHQDLPFERLVEELVPQRDAARTPLVQVLFALEELMPETGGLAGLEMIPVRLSSGTAKADLNLTLARSPEGFGGSIEYSTDLFDRTTIQRLALRFERLLCAAAEAPDEPVDALPLLAAEERQQVVVEWAAGIHSCEQRERCVHELFEEQAARTPDLLAVSGGDGEGVRLTYAELDGRAGRLARHLAACGVGPEVPVAVLLESSPELVVTLLAILKAGGAYVPLDPAYPAARLAFMLRDCRARVLVAADLPEGLETGEGVRVVWVKDFKDLKDIKDSKDFTDDSFFSSFGSFTSFRSLAFPESLAYVLYTSGSTGLPKGVSVTHGNLVPLLLWSRQVFGLGEHTRVLQSLSHTFDFGVFEVLTTLSFGGALFLRGGAERGDVELYRHEIRRHAVNTLHATPSFFRAVAAAAVAAGERLSTLEVLHLGGEALTEGLVTEAFEVAGEGCRLFNGYGPTEATVNCALFEVGRARRGPAPVPIGRPSAAGRLYVLDRRTSPVPVGVPGELLVGGVGLSRGYLGQPGLTAERFVPDPFGPPGGRLYRTGDRARWLADGTLEVLGRLDGQIKLRGFRIEPGEIEAVAAACPGVEQAAVLLRQEPSGPQLVAWLVPASPARDTAAVRAFLRSRLPEPMIPAAFVWLDALPLTANGKLDRRALARIEASAEPSGPRHGGAAALRTPIEEGLAGIWREVLGVGAAGPDDDFFELGGHSLLATQVASRVREAFGVELPLRDLFASPRLADLAAQIEEERRRGAGLAAPPVAPVPRGDFADGFPLSFGQQWMWIAGQLNSEAAAYNAPLAIGLHGPLDAGALATALREVARRHEVLRTRFGATEAGPFQTVDPSLRLPIAVADLGALPAPLRERETVRLAQAEAARPFDLAAGPPARALLLRRGTEEHLLLLGLHHLVTDGWSAGVLLREVAALYGGARLPELPVQYGDYAVWQRRWLAGEVLETLLGWWREELAGPPPVLALPADRPGAGAPGGLGARLPFRPAPAQVEALRTLARGRGSTLFAVLLAAWSTLLARFARQDDLVIGTPVANRTRRELEGLIGYFVNDVPLRTRPGGDPAFLELLARVHETALGAWAHQDLPLQRIVQEVGGGAPLFRTWFQLQNMRLPGLELPDVKLALREVDAPAATFDLELLALEKDGGLAGHLVYNRELFHRETAESLLRSFLVLIEGIAADPARRLSDLPLLTPEERRAVLQGLAPVAPCPGDTLLHRAFEAVAAARPQAPAVTCEGESLTYAELNRKADILARRLRAQGVGPESRVGLRVERSLELVVGILGILKAGGAYVPIDPDSPRERQDWLLEDAQVPVLVTREESILAITRRGPGRRADGEVEPGHLAYVIYTSGSTGRPKGVMVTHRQAARLFEATRGFGFGPDDVWTLFHSYAFDFSVWELWGALLHGGRLVVVPHQVSRSPDDFLDLLAAEQVTVLNQTPSAFYQLLRAEEAREGRGDGGEGLRLRRVIFGGEALEPSRLLPWLERHGDTEPVLVNMYGITETTVHVTLRQLTRADAASADSVLGRPLDDLRLVLLDAALGLVPPGAVGEICVGGGGVARGYLGRPELTAERFVPDPFGGELGEPGARLYRSGDLARRRRAGDLVYLGRADRQLKIRGFRIEPGEVEAALVRHPAVAQAAVFARTLSAEDVRLAACIVPRSSTAPTSAELREHLLRTLPEPWVPGLFVAVPALPLTAHGKVDRQALANLTDRSDPSARSDRAAADAGAPLSPLEEHLAGLWAGLLGVDHVGRDDNFFTLGGHSLLVTWIAARVREAFGIPPPMRSFFERPTVGNLAVGVLSELAERLGRERFEEIFALVEGMPEGEVGRLVEDLTPRPPLPSPPRRPGEGAPPPIPSPPAPLPRAGEGRTAGQDLETGGGSPSPGRWGGDGRGGQGVRSVRDLLDLLPPPSPAPEPPLRVTTMAFPTCNRPAVLERGLASHAGAVREHGRELRFAVLDDSPDAAVREEYRSRLAALRRRLGVEIVYAGREEKLRFAAALRAEGLPPEAVTAALFDPESVGLPIGANRNAVLLQTAGEGVVSVDDDTLARGGPPPEPEPGVELLTGSVPHLAFLSAREPGAIRGFASRAEAMAAVDLRTVDLPGVHEELLGREVGDWLRGFDPEVPAVLDRADPAFLRSLESGGRVVVTTNGWVGDCGWRSPIFYMLLTGDSWRHLVRSAGFYRTVTASKEIVRFMPRPAVGNAESFMATMFCGFDNRSLLPPFPPVLWGEDLLYGLTLQLAFPAARAGHLPWVALHDPLEQRGFWPGEMARTASGIDHSRLVSALLAGFVPDFSLAPADALRRLGAFLQELGRMEPGAFDELARLRVRARAEAFAAGLEARLAGWRDELERPEAGELWAADVRRYLDLLRRHAEDPGFAVPLDLLYHREPEEARRLAQRLLVHHGLTLACWPDLVDAVRGLKARGRSLAEAVP